MVLLRLLSCPWLILGDFNDIACVAEKSGGNFDSGGQNFINWIDRNQLIDLGFSRAKFTWCNKRNADAIIWKRLDRGLSNIAWRLLFPEAYLSHLPRVNSDHCPIMVRLSFAYLPDKDCVPFRFQAMWFTHPKFSEFIADLWQSNNGNAVLKYAGLVSSLVSWNRQLENELSTEYNLILEQEELFWLQKSRNTWLADSDLEGLSCEVTDDEVKNSMFAIGGLKTPGPDGFPALFYQKCWGMCSADIIALVKDCVLTAFLPENINETLIALVPKVERPVSMSQLSPISLCNTLYKVISKILVAQLRPCMANLVSPNQVSFVPGRQIVDNIVVAQEMLHKFKNSKGSKGFIAWKIDLSKAYDRLNWDFIREVLWEVGICGRILELLM
ncbi:hypothetical protein L3X38_033392 [Prunus dulcis]|uniref:Reverse transcriptase domain-containing protein n=1 Tax=Prunus dulcis TaxID=3755 RepID=A0AAD4VH94_PRUDU|nr:hypothetical protein L3X38_033392 [Prunus dulcis]